jgi:RNA-binding protein PNO1
VPPHRLTPLRHNWEAIVQPVVEYLRLQIRYNPKKRCVELKTSEHTEDASALQRASDFVDAFCMGFEVQDAVALLRLEDLYIDSFEVTDVKMLHGDHLSRAIGRIAGQDGQTKYAIENSTRTRIVIADQKIHILGSFSNIKVTHSNPTELLLCRHEAHHSLWIVTACARRDLLAYSGSASGQGLQPDAQRRSADERAVLSIAICMCFHLFPVLSAMP